MHISCLCADTHSDTDAKLLDNEDTGIKVESLMCFTRAKSYLLLGNYRRASDSFKEALKVDTRCSGALDSLVKLNSMTEKEGTHFEYFIFSDKFNEQKKI